MWESIANRFKGTFSQFIAVFTACIIAMSDGMQYGWTAPVSPYLLSEKSHIKVTENQIKWLETILMIGSGFGLLVTVQLVDRWGRKNCIFLATVISFIVWTTIAVSNIYYVLLAVRFLAGIVGNMVFVAVPMYIAEIADQKIRGFLSSIISLMMQIGIIMVYSIVPSLPRYGAPVIACVLVLFEFITFRFMPDSPYYLLQKNKVEKAEKSLMRLRKTEDVSEELDDIRTAVQKQHTETGSKKDILFSKYNLKALMIMVFLNSAQHMGSFSVILMNLHLILEKGESIYMSPSTAGVLFSILMLVATILASFSIDKFGRKTLLIVSSIFSGACLLSLAFYFLSKHSGVNTANISWLPIVSIMVYGVAFKFGMGTVPIVVTAEIFPAKVKALDMTIADFSYVGFSTISLEVFYALNENFGMHVPFFIFSSYCFLTTVFTVFFIPETKGKTLQQIQFILSGETYSEERTQELETMTSSSKEKEAISLS